MVKLVAMNGSESWALIKKEEIKTEVSKMRTLIWLCGYIKLGTDIIYTYKCIRESLGVTDVEGKVKKNRLRSRRKN